MVHSSISCLEKPHGQWCCRAGHNWGPKHKGTVDPSPGIVPRAQWIRGPWWGGGGQRGGDGGEGMPHLLPWSFRPPVLEDSSRFSLGP